MPAAQEEARALIARVLRAVEERERPAGPLDGVAERRLRRPRSGPDRFAQLIRKTARGCWRWRGPVDGDGNPYVRVSGNRVAAHRHMWLVVLRRQLRDGQRLVRTCGNRLCVRPDHLAPYVRRGA